MNIDPKSFSYVTKTFGCSMKDQPLQLADLPEGLPAQIAGDPCFYYWRDIAHIGDYQHPVEKWQLSITKPRIDHWAHQENIRLADDQIIPINVDHRESARDVQGYVKAFRASGNTLEALMQYIGEDARKLAAKNYLSPMFESPVTDTKGKVWRDCITHVALTPTPVVTSLQSYKKAASRVGNNLLLDLADAPNWRIAMPEDNVLPYNEADWRLLCSAMPGLDGIPKANALSHVARYLSTVQSFMGPEGVTSMRASLTAGKPPTGQDAEYAAMAAESLAKDMPVNEATCKKLCSILIKDEKGNFSRALAKGDDGAKPIAMQVFAALSENVEAPAAGPKTPAQAPTRRAASIQSGRRTVARETPNNDPATDPEMVQYATDMMSDMVNERQAHLGRVERVKKTA